jgi:thiopurine S-methyltransferase
MMEPEFWLQRWREGRIGFHQDQVTPLLEQHWDALRLPAFSRVLVPLAGKSLDLLWLAQRGHRVLGVELSRIAVDQFFTENALKPKLHASRLGTHYIAGRIEMICGDAFALDAETLADCTGLYDRAALIALPAELRSRYARTLSLLPAGCRGLLITLEYPQDEKAGPPFSVEAAEVDALFADDWRIEVLERRDILATQPGFLAEGVGRLSTAAYRLQRKG